MICSVPPGMVYGSSCPYTMPAISVIIASFERTCKMKQMRYNQVQFSSIVVACLLLLLPIAACAGNPSTSNSMTGIHKIQHIIVIMQENRSFDSYFGTYPGADGIPMQNNVPTVCVPNPKSKQCVRPYHDRSDVNLGGPHGSPDSVAEIDGGKMDGFVTRIVGWPLNLYP